MVRRSLAPWAALWLVLLITGACGDDASVPEDFSLEITAPAEGAMVGPEDDVDEGEEGVQIDVIVVSDAPDGTLVTLMVNDAEEDTEGEVAEGEVVFEAVSLMEGINVLQAVSGAMASEEISVTVDGSIPWVTIASPEAGDILRTDEDSTMEGFQTSVEAFTDGADGFPATLRVNSASSGTTRLVSSQRVLFTGVTLEEGANTIEVSISDTAGNEGTDSVTVTVDTSGPALAFTNMADGAFLCSRDDTDPARPGLQIQVEASAEGAQGGHALLEVKDEGGEVAQTYQATVEEGLVSFLLSPPDGALELTLTVTSEGGMASAVSLSVEVDSLGPEMTLLAPLDGEALGSVHDLDPATPEVEVDVEVLVEGGQEVTLTVNGEAGQTLPVSQGAVTFAQVPLPSGDVQMLLVASDGCNVTETAANLVVLPAPPALEILAPQEGACLGVANDVDPLMPDIQSAVEVACEADDGTSVNLQVQQRGITTWFISSCSAGQAIFDSVWFSDGEATLAATTNGDSPGLSAEVHLTVSSRTPQLAFLSPLANAVLGTSVDEDPALEGLQVPVIISADLADEAMVLLEVNGLEPREAQVAGGTATFPAVTLSEGQNLLRVSSVGQCGNVGAAEISATASLSLYSLRIQTPEEGACLGVDQDLDPIAPSLQTDVIVESDAPEGWSVILRVESDQGTVELEGTLEAGLASFRRVTLSSGEVTLVAEVSDGVNMSQAMAHVFVDPLAPVVAIVSPAEGAVLGPEDDLDREAVGLQTDVVVETTAADGALASLHIPPDGAVEGEVQDGLVTFAGVTLPERSNMVLSVEIVSRCGNEGQGQVQVSVQLTDLAFAFVAPTQGQCLGVGDDLSPNPGIQATVEVEAELEDGEMVRLLVPQEGAPVELTSPVETGRALFDRVSLPEGDLTLTARAREDTLMLEAAVDVTVDSAAPTANIVSPDGSRPLGTEDDADPEAENLQIAIEVETDAPDGSLAHLDVEGEEHSVQIVGTMARFEGVTLVQGENALVVTVQDECGNEGQDELTVTVDLGVPEVEILAPVAGECLAMGDDTAPELGLQTTVVIRSTAGDGRDVFLDVTGSDRTDTLVSPLVGETATFALTLPEGAVSLLARASDGINTGVSRQVDLTVDSVVPLITIEEPREGTILGASDDVYPGTPLLQFHVTASTDLEDGAEATLEVRGGGTYGAQALGGVVVFEAVTMGQGENTLVVTALDDCGNEGTHQVRVTVNLDLPEVEILGLEPGICLGLDWDENPAPGLQVTIQVRSTAGDGLDVSLEVTSGGDTQTLVGQIQGDVATFTTGLPEGEVTLQAWSSDGINGGVSLPVSVTVDSLAPSLLIVEPAPDEVLGAEDDLDPEEPLLQVDVVVETDASAGTEVLLEVVGGGSYRALVAAGQARFAQVDLNQGENHLSVVVEDGCNNRSRAATDLNVNLNVPQVEILMPAQGACLGMGDDEGPAPGMQSTVVVRSTAGEGLDVTLEILGQGVYTAPLVGGSATFPALSLPEGEVTLVARSSDGVNEGVSFPVAITVDSVPPTVTITQPLDGSALTSDDDLDPGTANLQIDVQASTDVANGTTLALIIGANRYTAEALGGAVAFEGVTLAEGHLALRVEVENGCGNRAWDEIQVVVDLAGPSVTIGEPLSGICLGLSDDEDPAPGLQTTVVVSSDAGDGREVTLTVTGQSTNTYTQTLVGMEATFAGLILPEGEVTLVARSSDGINEGESLPTSITVDSLAPWVDMIAPVEGGILGAEDDEDLSLPNLQTTVVVTTDRPNGTSIGLEVEGGGTYTAEVQAGQAQFAGITLAQGVNDLVAMATDDCGNSGMARVQVQVNLNLPQVEIQAPLQGVCLAIDDDTTPSNPGLQYTVMVWTDVGDGSEVTLEVSGDNGQTFVARAQGGLASFPDLTLPEGGVELEAWASDGVNVGYSLVTSLTVDSVPPQISIIAPADGQPLGVQDDLDPGQDLLQTQVVVQTSAAGGTLVTLAIEGGESYSAPVASGQATFPAVTLGQGENTLSASVSDPCGNLASHAVDVDVDMNLPEVAIVSPLAGTCLGVAHDQDPAQPGLQATVDVSSNAADGLTMVLTVTGQRNGTYQATLSGGLASFPDLTLPEGTVTLRAEVNDGLNVGTSLPVTVTVDSLPPIVAIQSPLDRQALDAQDDTSELLPGLQIDVVATTNLPEGSDLALEVNGLSVDTRAVVGGTVLFPDVTLPEGAVTLAVEGEDGCTNSGRHEIRVDVDSQPPQIVILQPAAGACLGVGLDEDVLTPGLQATVVVQSDAGHGQPVTLWVRGQTTTTYLDTLVGDEITFLITLPQGPVELQAETNDGMNSILSETVTLSVDGERPLVEITAPAQGATLGLDDDRDPATLPLEVDVTVLTDQPEGAQVFLQVNGGGPVAAPATSGQATFPLVPLAEGANQLLVYGDDPCGNRGDDSVTVTVNTGRPTLTITDPPDGTCQGVDDDERAATAGLQRTVIVTSDAGQGQTVLLTVAAGGDSYEYQAQLMGNTATFGALTLPEGEVSLEAQVSNGVNENTSPTVAVTVDMAPPLADIESPGDGALLGTAQDLDPSSPNSVEVNVTASTDLADGSSLALQVDGGASMEANVTAGRATFSHVSLAQGLRILTLSAQDDCTNGSSDQIRVTVELGLPQIQIDQPLAGACLNASDDVDVVNSGFQQDIEVSSDAGAGQMVHLTVTQGASQWDYDEPLLGGLALFPAISLPEGSVTLSAYVENQAGNGNTSAPITLTVDTLAPTIRIVSPANGALLGVGDDLDPATPNILDLDVTVETSAANGTAVTLEVDGGGPLHGVATDGRVIFTRVPLADGPGRTMTAQVTDTCGNAGRAEAAVDVDLGIPTVDIDFPSSGCLSRADDGNPATTALDIEVVVSTDVGDGLMVSLSVNQGGTASYQQPVVGGQAVFPITLVDGSATLVASVSDGVNENSSLPVAVQVDTQAPLVRIDAPSDGALLGMADDGEPTSPATLELDVVVSTDLPNGTDVTLQVGLGAPVISQAQGGMVTFPLVSLTAGANTLTVSAQDSCTNPASDEVTVQVDLGVPLVFITYPDMTADQVPTIEGIQLNATSDNDPATEGLQHLVTIQSDAPDGGAVTLHIQKGGQHFQYDAVLLGGTATFPNLTLPQGSDITLWAEVSDGVNTGTSAPLTLDVDSVPPTLSINYPLCATTLDSGDDMDPLTPGLQTDIYVSTGATRVTLTINGEEWGQEDTLAGIAVFTEVTLLEGDSILVASGQDTFLNPGTSAPCAFAVQGQVPSIAITAPLDGAHLGTTQDLDPITLGLQVNVVVQTNAETGNDLQLTVDGGAPLVQQVPANGLVTFAAVTLPEGDAVTLVAQVTNNFGNTNDDTAVVTVDIHPPAPILDLAAMVQDDRPAEIRLSWTTPADLLGSVANYDIRYSTGMITDANFSSAQVWPYDGIPGAPDDPEQVLVTGLNTGVTYYFAIKSMDNVGNRSVISNVAQAEPVFTSQNVDGQANSFFFGIATTSGEFARRAGEGPGERYEELIVGDPWGGLTGSGDVYIYCGRPDGVSATPDVIIHNGTNEEAFGWSLAALDLNGDGATDLAVGAPSHIAGGRVYVFLGDPGMGGPFSCGNNIVLDGGDADLILEHTVPLANFGTALANAGDVNMDGRRDLLIGAYTVSNGGSNRGSAYLLLGREAYTNPRCSSLCPAPAGMDVEIRGTVNDGYLGTSLAGGPINADGRSDLVVGADGSNTVFVFHADPTWTGDILITLLATAANVTLTSAVNVNFGTRVAVADVDANGYGDVIASAPYVNGNRGAVYVFTNGQGAMELVDATTAQADMVFYDATMAGANVGYGLSVKDINGDALPDLLIGAPYELGLGDQAFLFYGPLASATPLDADVIFTSPGAELFGYAATIVGDIDGDGLPDISIPDVMYGEMKGRITLYR